MDTTLARPPIGQLLDGRYRVESHLAHGGMATVYLGTDTRLDRAVALKIMHAELANDEDFVRRFVSEARSVARLSHPNVVTVFDQGADGRTLYLAMEYVPGQTLRDLLRERGRLSPRDALDIMDGVLAGLAAAHEAGIAHRDVKPENVLLGDAPTVKVADFGLARLVSGPSHTKTGMLIGTAAYFAPEQVARGIADSRSDVYSAGVMLFELLTGTQPHTGENPLAVAYKHVNEVVPPPSSVARDLPPALDTLVAMATSRDPDLRPADAGQFLHAITGVRNSLLASAPPPPAGTGGPRDSSLADTTPPGHLLMPNDWRSAPAEPAGDAGWRDDRAGWDGDRGPGGWDGGHAGPGGGPAGYGSAPGGYGRAPSGYGSAPGGWDGPSSPPGGYGAAPGGWPDAPGEPHDAVGELIPGMAAPPARQSFGVPAAPTQAYGLEPSHPDAMDPARPPVHKTLIVSRDGGMPPYGAGPAGYPPAPREPRLQRLLFSRRLGYLAAGVVVVAVAALLGWWLSAGRYTTVPSLAGMTAASAQQRLHAVGLTLTQSAPVVNNNVPKGEIIRTVPASGARVARGAKVTVVVSRGPRMIQVPQVTGQATAAAQAALRSAGLMPGKVRQEPSATIAAGIVISTRPVAGTSWPQPRPVTLIVSAGPPVPDFVGQPKSTAEAWASQYQVQLNEVTVHHSNKPVDTVVRQSVRPGGVFTAHQVITIWISPGPPNVNIPNVDHMPAAQAISTLKQLGFQVTVNRVGPLNVVFNYSPSGSAPKGSTITLWVGF